MNRVLNLVIAAGCALMLAGTANSQTMEAKPGAPMRMKMSKEEFLQTHRFDESGDSWVLRTDMAPPMGIKTREEVVADRDMFLSRNRFDVGLSRFVPISGTPRDMSKLTREQVTMETQMFAKTHMYDIFSGSWVERATGKKMQM